MQQQTDKVATLAQAAGTENGRMATDGCDGRPRRPTVRDTINARLAEHREEVVRLERLMAHTPILLLNCPIEDVRRLAHPDLSII